MADRLGLASRAPRGHGQDMARPLLKPAKNAAPAPRRMGRPPGAYQYGPEWRDTILSEMASGRTIADITAQPGYPCRRVIWEWCDSDPNFAARYARAREELADYKIDAMDHIIANVTPESANADRVKLMGLQWLAARLNPRKYGDKVQTEVSGTVNVAAITIDAASLQPEQRAALRATLAAARAGAAPMIDHDPDDAGGV